MTISPIIRQQTKNRFIFLKECLAGLALLCGMAACSDTLEETDNKSIDTSTNAIWHSPEVLTRAQSQQQFLYNHAVGFSYNAMAGESYALKDVRCQIVNRSELDRLENVSDYFLYTINKEQKVTSEGYIYNSFTEYVQNANLKLEAGASIFIVGCGTIKAEGSVFEDGTVDSYVISAKKNISSGTYRLDADAIIDLAETHPSVLTESFRDAVRQVAAASDENYRACVDSFINTYGTHVVVKAEVGGQLNVLLQMEAKKFNTQASLSGTFAVEVLNKMFTAAGSGGSSSEEYEYLQNSKCHISAKGGNVKYLDAITSMDSYQIGKLDNTYLSQWQSSVVFAPDDYSRDATSVINMDFRPIYDFVLDPVAKRRIRSAIIGNVQDLIDQLGNRNFVNVSFPYNPTSLSYTLGGKQQTCESPKTVNIVYAGRHVATICTERINAIDASQDVRVVYPIYEGRIQLKNGFCVHDGHSYTIAWTDDECKVTDTGRASDSNMIYVTAGKPGITKYDNITYNEAHKLPAIETNLAITIDGSYNANATSYFVEKEKGHFYLPAAKGKKLTGIPNWTYDETTGMMKRDDAYVYVYNPQELSYND